MGYEEERAELAYRQLVTSFRRLPAKWRKNLLWHLERGTRILCGNDAYDYSHKDGAG